MKIKTPIILVLFLLFATGCGETKNTAKQTALQPTASRENSECISIPSQVIPSEPSNDQAESSETKSIYQTNVILSENLMDYNKDKEMEKLNVVMSEGKYFLNTDPGGLYIEGWNWEGRCCVQLIDSKGHILSEYDLSEDFSSNLIFFSKFPVTFSDYNDDGNPDFTISQHNLGSCTSCYGLYTITKDGQIKCLVNQIYCNGDLKKTGKKAFDIFFYDKMATKYFEVTYTWNGKEFIQGKPKEIINIEEYNST